MAPSAVVLQVFVFKNGEFIGSDLFTEREVVVGRDAGANLVLDSSTVSRSHAILEHDGKRVFVRDAGSTNGVFLNDRKVERGEVGRLDQVFVGEYSLKVKIVAQGGGPRLETDDETRSINPAAVAEAVRSAAVAPQRAAEPAAAPPRPHLVEPPAADPAKHADASPKRPRPDRELAHIVLDEDDDQENQAPPSRPAEPRVVAKARTISEVVKRAPFFGLVGRGSPRAAVAPQLREKPLPSVEPEPRFDLPPEPVAVRRPPLRRDEEDEEDAPYVSSFSMLRQTLDAGDAREKPTHVEVLVARGNSLTEAVSLRPGESYFTPGAGGFLRRDSGRRRLVAFRRNGECRVEFNSAARGSLLRHGEGIDLAHAASTVRPGLLRASLQAGESLQLEDGPRAYHIRLVRPPAVPEDARTLRQRLQPDRVITRSMVGSLGMHLLLIFVGFILPARAAAPVAESESFADVKLDKEVHLEEPPPPPPPPVKQAEAAPQPKVAKQLEAAPNKHARAGGTAKAPPGVLGLLSKVGSSAAPGPAAALAAVSNLSAANTPSAGGFRVSAMASNLPTSDILVGGGGGGVVVTKGGAALLRGGGGGAGQLSGKGTRQVGGLVEKMPQAMRAAGQGTLDRDAIQKVINQNVGQIQRCYERELLSNPGLSGKVEIEWTVGTNGSVHGARQKFSSLESVSAVNCILDKIRGWRFPEPKGGEVVVSYPFVFKSISF